MVNQAVSIYCCTLTKQSNGTHIYIYMYINTLIEIVLVRGSIFGGKIEGRKIKQINVDSLAASGFQFFFVQEKIVNTKKYPQ